MIFEIHIAIDPRVVREHKFTKEQSIKEKIEKCLNTLCENISNADKYVDITWRDATYDDMGHGLD